MSAIESRISAGRKQRSRGGFGPLEGQPTINRFNAIRKAACNEMKVAYGQVYVGGVPSHVRSHEIRLDSNDASCFILPEQIVQHQQEREADAAWFTGSQIAPTGQTMGAPA